MICINGSLRRCNIIAERMMDLACRIVPHGNYLRDVPAGELLQVGERGRREAYGIDRDRAVRLESHIEKGHFLLSVDMQTPEHHWEVGGRSVQASQRAARALQDPIRVERGMRTIHLGPVPAAIALAGCSLIMVLSTSSAQQGVADPRRGHEIAARVCINCHVIDRETSSPMPTDVPSFPMIANRPGASAEHIAGRIIIPHPAMPGVPLTVSEIRDIVAYIVSLRRND